MADSNDDFKIDVIKSIEQLAPKMPHKFKVLTSFITKRLKEQGSFDLKKQCVQSLDSVYHSVAESKEFVLNMLTEYSEDCEYDLLLNQVLYLIGENGPKVKQPSKFIRTIYNRMILEQPSVRAAAVVSLAKFSQIESLKPRTLALLRKCLEDTDDEVRERAAFYCERIENG